MTNNELFFNLYNELDDCLRDYYDISNLSTSAIVKRINELNNSPSINDNKRGEQLDIIRNLRNSLAHVERVVASDENFLINQNIIDFLRHEIEIVDHPVTAFKICVPISKVLCAGLDCNVSEVANSMIKNGYTHIPILKDGCLYGVFSENTIFSYFVEKHNIKITNKSIILEYDEYLNIHCHATEYFIFVAKDMKISEIYPLFAKKNNCKRLSMIFVTEHGKENEKVLGIITSYDLLIN